MSHKIVTLAVAVFLVIGFAVPRAHAEEKIALVSLQRALNEVNEGKSAKAKLKKDFETKKKEIDGMKLELDTMGKELDKQKLVLSQEALKTKSQEFQNKYVAMQQKAADYEKEFRNQDAETAQRIIDALRGVVSDLSSKEGYTLVIENSAETVLFAKNAQDITDKVIATYNASPNKK